jgi:signal peptidase I
MPLIKVKGQNLQLSHQPWLAVNLSMFFPGIGQLYAGEKLKGIGFISGGVVLIAIVCWSFFSATGNTVTGLSCLVLFLGVYIFNLFDAYTCVKKQLNVGISEKIPRKNKDPWFAVFLSRVLPGLGHLYIEKAIVGAVLMSLFIVFSSLARFFNNVIIFVPIIYTVACYHAFVTFPRRQQQRQHLIAILALFILIFGLLGSYLPIWINQTIEVFVIPSNSMLPTLQAGDRILVDKSRNYSPKQGDLIVFKTPDAAKILEPEEERNKEQYYIKRVIGEPEQVIRVNGGVVYIDNQPLQETYIEEAPAYEWGPEAIPAKSYFVMGDNRNNSFDSHVWGFLEKHYIVGKSYKVFWPPDRVKSLLSKN